MSCEQSDRRPGGQGESIWAITLKDPRNPHFIAGGLLSRLVPGAVRIESKTTPGSSVDIVANGEGLERLKQLDDNREFQVLRDAYFFIGQGEPDTGNCQWPGDIKTQVRAFYWQSRADSKLNEAGIHNGRAKSLLEAGMPAAANNARVHSIKCEDQARRYQEKAKGILGKLEPIRKEEITKLVQDIIERELATV